MAAFAKPLLPAGRFISSNFKIKHVSTEWENVEPAPIEFMHGRLLDLFHEWRKSKTENTTVEIDGIAFNNIIAKAKTETYAKYHKQNLKKTIPKSEM